ncbi:putative tail fiber protein [Halorubrum virus HRTV-11]|nr:putative tail fiber protein [Halorubrum virus HRTV-11]
MAYQSKVKTYGAPADERAERPDSWRWKQNEPPVAEYLNDLNYNVIEDIKHLVALTNAIDPDNDGMVANADKLDGKHAEELGGFKYVQTETPDTPAVGNSWFKDTNGLILVGDGEKYQPQPEVGYSETEDFTEQGYKVLHETVPRTMVDDAGSIRLINELAVVNFDEAKINPNLKTWEWTDSSGLTAQNTTVISGTHSGEYSVAGTLDAITLKREAPIIQDFETTFQVGSDTGNISDYSELIVKAQDGTLIGGVRFNDGNGSLVVLDDARSPIENIQSAWSVGQNYSFEWDWDFGNSQYDLYMNGALVGTYPVPTGVSDFGEFTVRQDNSSSGATRSVFIDDLHTGAREYGEAVITLPVPDSRIESWDIIRIMRTSANESVVVDVEDSTGTTLLADVHSEDDLSAFVSASENFQLRAKFSRTNTANNPSLDGVYRRWTMRPGDHGMSDAEREALDRQMFIHQKLASR